MIVKQYHAIPPLPGALAAQLTRTALTEGSCVRFEYDGKSRLAEPHAIGLSPKDGSLVMRAYLPGDDRPWRLFTLSKIEAMFIVDDITSEAPRAGYTPGDKQMAPVLVEIQS